MRLFNTILLILCMTLNVAYANQKTPPLTIVVPYPPGGDTDIIARMFATKYTEKTGRATTVENRPGAAGVIGFMYIIKAPNDGSVIGLAPSTITSAPYFNSDAAKYNPKTDFTPILQVTSHSMHMVVNSETGVKSIRDLIVANKNGKIKAYGSPGIASPQNIFGETFKKNTGTDMIHVPYKGNAEIINALLNNTIQMAFNTSLSMQSHIESGKLTVIASTGSKRSVSHPTVPTLSEQGIRGLELESWLGVIGPKDMDPKIASEFNSVLVEIMKQPDVQDRLRSLSMTPTGLTPEHFRDSIQRDSNTYQRLSKEITVKIE